MPATTLAHGRNFRMVQTTGHRIFPAKMPKYILQTSVEFYYILESSYSVLKTRNGENIHFEIVVY
jgi:hypothetical protein